MEGGIIRVVLPRFLANIESDTYATLPEDEARHARTVLRLAVGAVVAVFDGRGREWRASIEESSKACARVRLIEPLTPAREPRVPIVVLQAVLKGDHMDAVVRDAVMVGASTLIPVLTAFTATSTGSAVRERARDRWRRVALASAKQCRRATLPEIPGARPLLDALQLAEAIVTGSVARVVLAEPAAGAGVVLPSDLTQPDALVMGVGPEGGWAPGELETMSGRGFTAVTLGTLTLRADAAALVAISMFRAVWKDL